MRLRLLLAVLALSSVMLVPSARAQTELDNARALVAEATEELENYLDELETTQRRGNELAAEFWQAQGELEALEVEIAASRQASTELGEQRSGLIDEVRIVALDRYVSRSDEFPWTDVKSRADRAAAEALAQVVVGADTSAIDRLLALDEVNERTRAELDEQVERQQVVLDGLVQTQTNMNDELARLASLRAVLDSQLTDLERALAGLEEVEAERQAVAAEQVRVAEERARAEAAAAAARLVPTPAPTVAPPPTAVPTATAVPNPQLPDPTATAVPNPQLPDATATAVPNPQLPDATATAVPNPQLPDATATPVPNPQPSEPLPTPVPNPQPAPGGGGIVCPLAGPFTHIDDFNAPRAVGGVHRANDLIAAQGTPVLAVASGTVEHRDSRVGGLSAHLKGDNGDYYFYTHLSGYENVGAGWVAAGTTIGYVGETGNAPIPHLHFEIHRGGYGNYVNPYGPVRQACGL